MHLTDINREFIESCLRNFRSGQIPDEDIRSLHLTGLAQEAPMEEVAIALEDQLDTLVWENYAANRQREQLNANHPVNRESLLAQLSEDFSKGNQELEAWSALYFRYRALPPLSVEELSSAANMVPQQFRRRLNMGLDLLTQAVRRLELAAHRQKRSSLNKDLPLPDFTHLIGVKPYYDQLDKLLNQSNSTTMFSLEGMGGVGKTALARGFVELPETKAHWTHILWLSARQYTLRDDGSVAQMADNTATLSDITARMAEQLGLSHLTGKTINERLEGIQAALSIEPHLVVIDNLETVSEYIDLIPALAKIAGTSRFLITSRQTLKQFPYVHTIQIKELDRSNAMDLFQEETDRQGFDLDISEERFNDLFELIGGLPLAIKLAAAQVPYHPFEQILDGFREAKGNIQDVYRYLYWQTWQLLSDTARHLLLSFLPADPEGEDLDFIRIMSGLPDSAFYQSLRELDHFSLLEVTGNVNSPRYRLHRLTVTFLQTDILRLW